MAPDQNVYTGLSWGTVDLSVGDFPQRRTHMEPLRNAGAQARQSVGDHSGYSWVYNLAFIMCGVSLSLPSL